jgi:cytoskeletal protein RodZ
MINNNPTTEDALPSSAITTSAGAVLRGYRLAHGVELDAMAKALRVSAAKLSALENDQLDALPDAMFARALSLAVCRHLKTDANPVLALLPEKDVNRLALKSERGLDFPLERPSLLPQSSFVVIERFFTPMRWAALLVFLLAIALAAWPDLQPWLVFKDDAQRASVVVTPVEATAVTPLSHSTLPVDENNKQDGPNTSMVVTPVYSPAVSAHQSAPTPVEGASAHAK